MKIQELRKKSDKELIQIKKDLEFNKIKASCNWGRDKVKDKEVGINITAKKGAKTSLQKQIRRTIAQVNTLLNERKNDAEDN